MNAMTRNLVNSALASVCQGVAEFAEAHPEFTAGLQVEIIVAAKSIAKLPPEVFAELADTKMLVCFPAKANAKKKPPLRNGTSGNGTVAAAGS